jgi:CheY-like chemotaxis protein
MTPNGPWILVVDDDEEIRETLDVVLAQYGLQSFSVSSGMAALELLHEGPPPQVVLIDLRMPAMSGGELVEQIRREPGLEATPVVVMSGDSEAPLIAERLGADGCLRKPFELAALVDTMRRYLDRPGAPAGRRGPETGSGAPLGRPA